MPGQWEKSDPRERFAPVSSLILSDVPVEKCKPRGQGLSLHSAARFLCTVSEN